jgi:NADPH:quinone reductase-like Zn-dependent oxidoreductase
VEAASLPIAALTAWSAWQDAQLRPGQTALVIGTGGVSLFGVQLARLCGAEVIVVGGEAAGLECAARLGARSVLNRRLTPAWGEAVRQLTGGEGVHAVLDVAGSATFAQLPQALAMGGTVAMVGYASGARLDFDLRSLFIARRARLHGHTVGSRRDFEAMCRALEAHRSRPVIDAVYPWNEAPAALARLRSGRAVGKILIEL